MSQLVFKFPFKTKYFKQDFYVSNNDNLKQIRIIKPNVINQVTNAFYDAIREI